MWFQKRIRTALRNNQIRPVPLFFLEGIILSFRVDWKRLQDSCIHDFACMHASSGERCSWHSLEILYTWYNIYRINIFAPYKDFLGRSRKPSKYRTRHPFVEESLNHLIVIIYAEWLHSTHFEVQPPPTTRTSLLKLLCYLDSFLFAASLPR